MTLARLRDEREGARRRIRGVEKKIAQIVAAVEAGRSFRAFADRLEELEAERAALEEELERIKREMEKVRQHSLSVRVMAESDRSFPRILDWLLEGEGSQQIKDLIGRYVEVLDWHQDKEDPTTGTVDIILFEQPAALVGASGETSGAGGNGAWGRCEARSGG